MKHLDIKNPYDLAVGIAGMITGCITYLSTNLKMLWTGGWSFSLEKIVSLAFACLVAFSTGLVAVIGKKLGDHLWERYFKKKKQNY